MHMDLTMLTNTPGNMSQSHMMGERVHASSFLGGQMGGEDQVLSGVIVAEKQQFRIRVQGVGIIQIQP